MNRIFLTLSSFSNIVLIVTFILGWSIGDTQSLSAETQDSLTLHFLIALAACILAMLVHAVALTYFMGTGRWIEETSEAYGLEASARQQNIRFKYRIIPGMILCVLLLLATGAFGAIADPASDYSLAASSTIHFLLAVSTLTANLLVNWVEWSQIAQNGELVDAVMSEVNRIRREKGLSTSAETEAPEGA